jgi:hypothetical protein
MTPAPFRHHAPKPADAAVYLRLTVRTGTRR